MSKLLLVNPRLPDRIISSPLNYLDKLLAIEKSAIDNFLFETYVKKEYQEIGIKKTFHEHSSRTASLGLLTLAAVLEEEGHTVYYHQVRNEIEHDDKLKELISECDILGVTAICTTWDEANQVVKFGKEINPEIITIIGGPQATHMNDSPLNFNSSLDYACIGDGEEVIKRLAEDPRSQANVSEIIGLDYRKNSHIVRTGKAKKVDIKAIPTPSYNLVEDDDAQIYIQFSRGCENSCAFCSESGKETYKTYDQMLAEFNALEKVKQQNLVFIVDSNFYGNEEKLSDYRNAVIDSATTNYFTVQARITAVNEVEETACLDYHIANKFLGLENLSDTVLDTVKKNYSWDTLYNQLKMLKDNYQSIPRYRVNFIQGLPGESQNEMILNMQRRKQLLDEELIIFVNDSIFTPTPGSPIFNRPQKYGLNFDNSAVPKLRNNLPLYNYNGNYSRSSLDIFLNHMEMRCVYNDYIIDRYDLGHIRNNTLEMVNTNKSSNDISQLFRC